MKNKKEGSVPQNAYIDVIIRKLESQKKKFLVANVLSDDIPIIYCNDNFCTLTGYNRGDVIRRSACLDFLYGPQTSPKSIRDIKNSLHDTKEKNISVLFYKKNGWHFRCNMVIAPVRNESGKVRLFVLNLHLTTDDKHRPLLGSKVFGGFKLNTGSTSSSGEANQVRRRNRNIDTHESIIPEDFEANLPDNEEDDSSNEGGTSWLRNISKFIHHGTLLSVLVKNSTLAPTTAQAEGHTINQGHHSYDCKDPFSKPSSDLDKTSIYAYSRDSNALRSTSSGESDSSPELGGNEQKRYKKKTIPRTVSSTDSDILINENKPSPLEQNLKIVNNKFGPKSSAKSNIFKRLNDRRKVDSIEKSDSDYQKYSKHIPDKFAKMLSTEDDTVAKTHRHDLSIPFCTFRHDGLGKVVWDWFILILVVITAIVTPYSASFLSQELLETNENPLINPTAISSAVFHRRKNTQSKLTFFKVVDYVIDISFILDVFINFRTTYVNRSDELIITPGSIAVHYFKGWFLIDVISAVPYDFLIFFAESNQLISLMSLLKLARLLRLIRVVKKINQYTENEAAFLVFLMSTFSLIAHWLACFWYAIGNSERKKGHPSCWLEILAQETKQDYANGGPTAKSKYITALYFTFSSLTSVGFGNVSPNTEMEKVFSICVMLIGSMMYAGIFGHVSAIIQRLYSGTARYHTQMVKVKEFIRFHQIPNPLRQRLEEYFQHSWSNTNGIEMSDVLHSFPEGIQADICLHLNQNLLSTNPAFKNGSEGYLRTLSLKFETTHVPPGDTLIHSGDLLSNLYFIARGSVDILSKDNTTLAILSQGDIFGEHPCLNKTIGKSKCNVRAMTYCDLHKINRKNILETLQMYPESAQTFTDGLKITFDLRDELLSIALNDTKDLYSDPKNDSSLANQSITRKKFDNIYEILKREVKKRPTEVPIAIVSKISSLESGILNLDRKYSEAFSKLHQNLESAVSAIFNFESPNQPTSKQLMSKAQCDSFSTDNYYVIGDMTSTGTSDNNLENPKQSPSIQTHIVHI